MSTAPPLADEAAAERLHHHSWLEDVQAVVTGTLFVALGIALFRHAGLVTGGTAGIAFVLHYAMGWPFGVAFFTINLPFYLLAWQRMGKAFTVKTVVAVTLLSLLSELLPRWLVLQQVHPLFAALGGGLLIGAGFLILFRHHASLGGINVLVLYLQEKRGWRAGVVQAAIDGAILLAALPWVGPAKIGLSLVGMLAMNAALAINHRPGRYTAM